MRIGSWLSTWASAKCIVGLTVFGVAISAKTHMVFVTVAHSPRSCFGYSLLVCTCMEWLLCSPLADVFFMEQMNREVREGMRSFRNWSFQFYTNQYGDPFIWEISIRWTLQTGGNNWSSPWRRQKRYIEWTIGVCFLHNLGNKLAEKSHAVKSIEQDSAGTMIEGRRRWIEIKIEQGALQQNIKPMFE